MKSILTLYVVFVCATQVFAQGTATVPTLNKATVIGFDTPSGWHIGIRSDGSASFTLGSGPRMSGSAPAGSISFEDVYKSVVPLLRTEPGRIGVFVEDAQSSQKVSYYIQDRAVLRRIVSALRAKLKPTHANNGFEAKMNEYPPEEE